MSGDREQPWLTVEELAALPEGTAIEVLWSGGNGPHRYRLHREGGELYADSPGLGLPSTYNPLDFVGIERYHTRVRLVARKMGVAG